MTREQMELLLNYFDAKLELAHPSPIAPAHFLKELSARARHARQQLLASLPPASGN